MPNILIFRKQTYLEIVLQRGHFVEEGQWLTRVVVTPR